MTNLVEGAAVKVVTLGLAVSLLAGGGLVRCAGTAAIAPSARNLVRNMPSETGLQSGASIVLALHPSVFEKERRLERFMRRKVRHGTLRFVKVGRRSMRRTFAILMWLGGLWLWCFAEALPFAAVALLAGLWDRTLLRTWRQRGTLAAYASMVLGTAVYVRLLIDERSPGVARRLLVLSVLLVGFQRSFFGDTLPVVGFLGDLLMVACASRCFVWLCPEPLLREHAVGAAQARDDRLRRRARPPGAPGPGIDVSTR